MKKSTKALNENDSPNLDLKQAKKDLKELNKITRDVPIVLTALVKSKNDKIKAVAFLTEKYGEEKTKNLVDKYFFGFFDSNR